MSADVGNVEEVSFSNGVRATRERLAYCPMHGMDGNDGRCYPTEYVLYGFRKDEILARLVRCHRDGFGAPEEIVPVHKSGAVIVNRDLNTCDRYYGRLDRATNTRPTSPF